VRVVLVADLIWRAPGGEEERIPLPADGGIIGRSPGVEICIPHPSISRRHARLRPEVSGSWRITDLGSRNGVIVRSRRVSDAELAPADPIQLGDIVLSIVPETAAESAEEPAKGAAPPLAPTSLAGDHLEARSIAPGSEPFPFELLAERLEIETPPPGREAAPASEPGAEPDSASEDERAALLARVAELRATAGTLPAASSPGAPAANERPAEPGAESAPNTLPAAPRREGLFRASERRILFVVAALLATAALILTFAPDAADPGTAATAPTSAASSGGREPGEAAPAVPDLANLAAPESGRESGAATVAAPPRRTIVERVAALPPEAAPLAWRATAFLFGRGPTPAELALLGEEGSGALLAAARRDSEHWRHRARAALVRAGRSLAEPLPAELLPAETPLDLASWADRVRRLAPGGSEDPLPAPDGDDSAYAEAFRRALALPARPANGLGAALRSAWTVGAGRALDPEVEGWIDELALSQVAGEELLHRFLLLAAPAHPAVRAGASAEELARWLVPEEGDPPSVAAPVEAAGETAPADAGARDGERVPAELWWAVAVERRLPVPAAAAPRGGPPGRMRLEVLCPFPLRPLLGTPERVPRLWRRLDRSRLGIFARSERSADELHRLASAPAEDEAWVVAEGSAEGAARTRARVADGFLLPALGDLARRLALHPAREAHSPAIAAWLARAREGKSSAGERLFRAGGYHLVPGEWRAAAYRPATRALLLAGAHLLEHPGAASVVRVVLAEEPREGAEGEWEEWMTALELVAGRLDGHSFSLWLWGPAEGGEGSLALSVEWGPEVRRGWVTEEEHPAEELHPRLATEVAAPPGEPTPAPVPAPATGEEGG